MKCPCCGHEIEDVPTSALAHLPFSPTEQQLVETLAAAYPKKLRLVELVDAIYPYGAGPENERNIISVRLSHIRAKLKDFGWTITHGKIGWHHSREDARTITLERL